MKCSVLGIILLAACSACNKNKTDANAGTREDVVSETRLPLNLQPIAQGFDRITDVQFLPGNADFMVVLQQGGKAEWVSLSRASRGTLFEVDVRDNSELGLLGLAFHPRFAQNGRFFINYTPAGGEMRSRIAEWNLAGGDLASAPASETKVLIELSQPYSNHNAGQLQFGPDGYLYIGFGDGGASGDPLEAGQDPSTMLGKMLRIDVDGSTGGKPYGIPPDNPFVARSEFLPEIWALGMRNPWRFSFDPAGRLIVADVGQNKWEEINIVEGGKNYGWNIREGRHCFEPPKGCRTEGLADPVHEYGHDEGRSITGGYVFESDRISELRGKYIFGDLNGKLWAAELPESGGRVTEVLGLGRHDIMPATFGKHPEGDVLVSDYNTGQIFRMER